ncbi:dephospho-CoA kinase [Comamonas endophytica]|uniref:Dephospho-CoA kinase n=1 Tax=Comamonas endophytica TaxID=2949090 RepID=A0ABY6GDS1_9BURK|nr:MULTISPECIES: dephospho-CoA kinase [unclassified Acidovorax]MCD2512992.1 dephospho-CoA kinase [Acidovorax sp. D4N7]UYG52667.1 dephospho-CoA kinase [Acidovorax sp. 5MLIR]
MERGAPTSRWRTPRLGVTGGIGSGKSTFAAMLAARGAIHIDADQIARSVTAAGGLAMAPIAAAFGAELIDADGGLHRERMRALAFADPTARARLEAIVHPLVGQATAGRIAQAEQAGAKLLVLDIPLLVESGRWSGQLDQVLVVDCREATQIERVMRRSQLAPEAIERILAAQATRRARRAAADIIIYNDTQDLERLRAHAFRIGALFGL